MLKIITLSCLAFAFALNLSAQDEQKKEKIEWSIDLGSTYSLIGLSQRAELQFGVLATVNRHQFRAAPLFHIWSSEAANKPKDISLSGLALNYYYNLPTASDKFELYFKYEMAFHFYTNEWEGTYYNTEVNAYEAYSDQSSEFFWGNTVAYGFTYKPSKKMFLRLDFGGGVYVSSIAGEYKDYYGLTNARYDFRGYNDVGFFVKSAFSVGYNL